MQLYNASNISTPLGTMLAIADEKQLYFLDFIDYHNLSKEIDRFLVVTKSTVTFGIVAPITSIEQELKAYFSGVLKVFKTPFFLFGSKFQELAWLELLKVPYGSTKTYLEQATAIGKKSATRAVANANGVNRIAIVVPCHRIIQKNGKLGGYKTGVMRKQWLIEHEKTHICIN